ncbi:hypothetical protein OROMI_026803 [Orobanche minor]
MGKDNFLYLVTENDIYRVKLDGKLRTRRCPESLDVDSSEEFECIKLCMPADYVFPYDMQPITLDSDMCLVGGYFDQGHPNVNDLSFVINPNQNNTVLRAGPNLLYSSPTKCCVILSQLGSSLYVVDLGDTGFYLLEPNNSTGRGYTKRRLPSIPCRLSNSTWGRVIQNHTSWDIKSIVIFGAVHMCLIRAQRHGVCGRIVLEGQLNIEGFLLASYLLGKLFTLGLILMEILLSAL